MLLQPGWRQAFVRTIHVRWVGVLNQGIRSCLMHAKLPVNRAEIYNNTQRNWKTNKNFPADNPCRGQEIRTILLPFSLCSGLTAAAPVRSKWKS